MIHTMQNNSMIYTRTVKILTVDGVTLTLGSVSYDLKYETIENIIKSLEKIYEDDYPDFQQIWLQ